jgi:hypothetical protein
MFKFAPIIKNTLNYLLLKIHKEYKLHSGSHYGGNWDWLIGSSKQGSIARFSSNATLGTRSVNDFARKLISQRILNKLVPFHFILIPLFL